MMRIRIDINGHTIHDIHVRNRGSATPTDPAFHDIHTYRADEVLGKGHGFSLNHRRSDGARQLAARILNRMNREHPVTEYPT